MNRNPVLYRGRRFHLVYFGLFAALGGWAGMWIFARHLQLNGFALQGNAVFLFPALAFTCWLSARIAHFIALGKKFLEEPGRYLNETAFYVQGGIFGLLFASVIFSAWAEIPVWIFLDALALGAFPALFLGRLGCFNYGCCHGRPTGRRWGIAYRNPLSKVLRLKPHLRGVKLHPAPLYTAALNFAAFLTALFLAEKKPSSGTLAAFFLIYHGAARLFLDRFRDLRNWRQSSGRPPSTAAWSSVFFGIAVAALSRLFSTPAAVPLAIHEIGTGVLISISVAALLLFLGYGVHGIKVGSFFEKPGVGAGAGYARRPHEESETQGFSKLGVLPEKTSRNLPNRPTIIGKVRFLRGTSPTSRSPVSIVSSDESNP